jgi:ankyrin repeat protein
MQQQILNILEKYSEKNLSKISDTEISELKKTIKNFIAELELAKSKDAKKELVELRFGLSQNTILHLAAKFGDEIDLKKLLLEVGAEFYVDVRNNEEFTPLHFAAIEGQEKMLETLISNGADKNAQVSERKRRWSAIHYAARYGHLEIVKSLIESGVNKEVKTGFGLTPLLVAAEFGHAKIAQFLLNIGASCNVQTIEENHNMTALHYATIGNFKDVVEILLLGKADCEKETNLGLTAFEYAAKNNLTQIASLLLEWGSKKLESAIKIAQENKSQEVIDLIKKYQKAKDAFFKVKFLENSSDNLVNSIQKYNSTNLSEPKIALSDGVLVNAFGLLSLKQQFGFFKKVDKSLSDFLLENNLSQISKAIDQLSLIVKNRNF